jgi:hypothetical protein
MLSIDVVAIGVRQVRSELGSSQVGLSGHWFVSYEVSIG